MLVLWYYCRYLYCLIDNLSGSTTSTRSYRKRPRYPNLASNSLSITKHTSIQAGCMFPWRRYQSSTGAVECIRAPCHLLFSPLYGDKFRKICAWDGIGFGFGEVRMCLPVSVLWKVLAARPTRKEGEIWILCRCKGHFSIPQHGARIECSQGLGSW